MNKKNRNMLIGGAIILALVGVGIQQGFIPNPLAGFFEGGGLIPTGVEYVKASGKVQYENGTAIGTATVILQYTNLEGQSVTLSQTTDADDGTFTTGNAYVPEGVDVTLMVTKTNYHTRVFTSRVPVGDWSNRETAYLGEFVVYREATGAATTSALIENGADISTSYNYTLSGTAMNVQFTVSIGTAGMRAGNDAYTDIQTGYSYTSSFVVFKTNSNLIIPESYDDIVQVGTTFYYIYNVAPFWDNPNIVGDGSTTYSFGIDIQLGTVNATDSCNFSFYQNVRADYIDNANFGTALEAITNVDIYV